MKKTRLTIMALLVCAVMALGVAAGCGSKIAPGEYKPANPSGTQVPPADSITLDGKLDESIYTDGTLKWIDYTTIGTGDEGLASTAVQVKATTTYGEKGFYLIFDVSHTPVYVDLEHTRPSYIDSCMEVYLGFPGATSLEHNYQIDIAPDGNINVQKHNGAYYMDFYLVDGINAATVKGGEINTPEADGYIMEAYFPWEMFGYDEPLAAIQMDIAVIVSSREDAKGRDGWDQLGLSYNEKCQWANPATYWHWGSNGFEDSDLMLSIADYDTEKGSVSFGKTAYKAYEDVEINVAPTAGNILKSIKVNGVDRMLDLNDGKLVLPAYAETQNVKVEAEFIARPTDMVTVSGSVTQKAGLGNMLVDGKQIVFRSGESAFQARVQDGRYTVDLTKGEYTATLDGCADATVEITEATDAKNLTFYYSLFGDDAINAISADQSTVVTGKEWSDTILNVGETFVLDYSLKFKNGLTADSGDDNIAFGYYNSGNKHYLFDHYLQSGWDYESIRDSGDFWGALIAPNKNLAAGANAVYAFSAFEDGIPFRLIRVKDNFYWYIKTQNGSFQLIHKHTAIGDVAKMSLTVWGTDKLAFDLVDIAYSDIMPEVSVSATSNDEALGTVEAPSTSRFGVPTTVAFTPAAGCLLGRVTVNGVDMTGDVRDNTLVFTPDDYTCEIVAGFISESEQAFTVSGTLTATAGKSDVWSVPAGTKVTFVGAAGSEETAVGKNGTYSVDLKAGAYTVTAAGYKPFSLTVTGEATADKQLVYDLINDASNVKVSDDESTVRPNAAWEVGNVNIPTAEQWIFTCTMKATSSTWKHVVQLYDGTAYHDFGLFVANDVYKVGVGAANNADWIRDNGIVLSAADVDPDWTIGFNFAIVRDGKTFMAYLEHKDGKYYAVGSCEIADFTKFHLQFPDAANEWHNLSLTLGTADFDKPVAEVEVSGKMTAIAGMSQPWNIPEGTVLTFSKVGMDNKTTTVGANGAYTVTLPYGIYTVTANGYVGKLYVAGATADACLRYDLIDDSSNVVVNDDETIVEGVAAWQVGNVNIPAGEQWVFTCTMKGGANTWKNVIQLWNGGDYHEIGFTSDASAGILKVGVGSANNPDWIGNNGHLCTAEELTQDWSIGYDIAIVRDGNTFTAYVEYKDGKYHKIGELEITDLTKFHLQVHCTDNEWHNLSLTVGTTQLDNVYVAPEV